MERRNFLRLSALGITFIGSGLKTMASLADNKISTEEMIEVPVINNVDVLIIGGTTAGVAAAKEISQAGSSSMLITNHTYLGEDITGTYRYWHNNSNSYKSDLGKILFHGGKIPTPMKVKSTLDNLLIDNDIPFLMSSLPAGVLYDKNKKLSGVVIANRSGLQAIEAKVVIDASLEGSVTRLTTAKLTSFQPGIKNFELTLLGNQVKNDAGLTSKVIDKKVKMGDKLFQAVHFQLEIPMKDNTYSSFAKAEQIAREKTWDADQVDGADLLWHIPFQQIDSMNAHNTDRFNVADFNTAALKPKNLKGLYVLNGYADLDRQLVTSFMDPDNYILLGGKVGKEANTIAKSTNNQGKLTSFSDAEIFEKTMLPVNDFVRKYKIIDKTIFSVHNMPVLGRYDTIVMGGGTAGASAGIGAGRQGAKTLIIEQMHGLGGIGTQGFIASYFYGYRKGYTLELDKSVKAMGGENHPRLPQKSKDWIKEWKMEWLRRENIKNGNEIWFGAMGIGVIKDGNTVTGVIVATPTGPGIILAHTVIDSSGSADIAIAAGALFKYTDKNSVAIQGAGLPPVWDDRSYMNTDWTFINDSDVYDATRTFTVARQKFNTAYDVGKLLQTRERRRIVGEYEVGALDMYNKRRFSDTLSIHESSFDTHGFTIDPFFSIKPPEEHNIMVQAHVPLRSLLPKGLDGIIVTGLGASAHRDAMPVIRMQACLQNQGLAVGMGAAQVAKNGKSIRQLDIKKLQQKLVEIGNLPGETLQDEDTFPPARDQVAAAIDNLDEHYNGLSVILWEQNSGLAMLEEKFDTAPLKKKILYAHVLAHYGSKKGKEVLANHIKSMTKWDEGWNYRGMGQFGMSMSQMDSKIWALGKVGNEQDLDIILDKAKLLEADGYLSHFRVVSEACKLIGSPVSAPILYELLKKDGMTGHQMNTLKEAKQKTPEGHVDTSTRNNSLKEIFLADALYHCGDKNSLGKKILTKYSRDLRGHFARHATGILNA